MVGWYGGLLGEGGAGRGVDGKGERGMVWGLGVGEEGGMVWDWGLGGQGARGCDLVLWAGLECVLNHYDCEIHAREVFEQRRWGFVCHFSNSPGREVNHG